MSKENIQEEKKYSAFQWILFVIIIPLMFAITVVLVVLSVSGINVFEGMKNVGEKIPVISSIFDGDKEVVDIDYKQKYGELQGEIKNQEAYIQSVENQLAEKDEEIKNLQLEKETLLNQIQELELINENRMVEMKEIIKTYETMSAKNAAAIIVEMDDTEAMRILSNMKADALAEVLQKMPPEDAAKYTSLLTSE